MRFNGNSAFDLTSSTDVLDISRQGIQHRAVLYAIVKRRLRSDPELRKDRNARANNCSDDLRKFRRAIQLDHIRAGFFNNANGCPENTVHAFLKGTER